MGYIGSILVGIWLIFQGAVPLLHLSFRGMNEASAILAIAAGIMVLIKR